MAKSKFISIILFVSMLFAIIPSFSQKAYALSNYDSKVSTSGFHTLVIKSDSSLWVWGKNYNGRIGNGSTDSNVYPSPIKVMENVNSVSAGPYHTLAIKIDGSLWVWGDNTYGQLGDGTKRPRYTPVKIMDDVKSVSAGINYSLAIKTDGSLWAWGNNNDYQLGDGSTSNYLIPVKIMDDVKAANASYLCTMAVKTDGSLWVWGESNLGLLNRGTSYRKIPSPIKVMDDVTSASTIGTSTFILKTDGSLWGCGENTFGRLGDGTTQTRFTPIKIMDDVDYASITHCCSMAIKKDGSLWVWGVNNNYLMNSIYECDNYYSPIKIMDNVAAATSEISYILTIKTDGSLWAWGCNSNGIFGDGTTRDKYYPIKILDTDINRDILVAEPSVTCTPTKSSVYIDGDSVMFQAYNINGNNYFKLRDLAQALCGTKSQFEVGWDNANCGINISKGKPYSPVGGELLVTSNNPLQETATLSTSKIYLNGSEVSITAYNIRGNNYVKLRDVGLAIGFLADWDSTKNVINIDTKK